MFSPSLRMVTIAGAALVCLVVAVVVVVPVNNATNIAVDDLIAKVRTQTGERVVAAVTRQFAPYVMASITVSNFANSGQFPLSDSTYLDVFRPFLCSIANATRTVVFIINRLNHMASCAASAAGVNYYLQDPVRRGISIKPVNVSDPTYPLIGNGTFTAPYNPMGRDFYVQSVLNPGTWSPTFSLSNRVAATSAYGTIVYDTLNKSAIGAAGAYATIVTLGPLLMTIPVAKTGRVIIFENRTGVVMGGNYNETVAVSYPNASNPNITLQRLAVLSDASDPLLIRTINAMGGPTAVLNLPQQYDRVIQLPNERLFVELLPIVDYGLHLRCLIVIPRSDFTSNVEREQAIALGSAAAATVVLIIAASVALLFVMQPLADLADEMCIENTLAVNDVDGKGTPAAPTQLSRFREVRDIQMAYDELAQELRRVRSFLPQAVLRKLAKGANPDAEDDDESVLVTDRRSSNGSRKSGRSERSYHAREQRLASAASAHVPGASASGTHDSSSSNNGGALINSTLLAVVDSSMARKRVTIVAINVRSFEAHVDNIGVNRATLLIAKLVNVVYNVSSKHRGVIHTYHGDRIFVTFNAVDKCATHMEQAVRSMVEVRDESAVLDNQHHMELTMGCASGEVYCGNAGGDHVRQFSVIGSAYGRAAFLERCCRRLESVPVVRSGEAVRVTHLMSSQVALTQHARPYRFLDMFDNPDSHEVLLAATTVAEEAVDKGVEGTPQNNEWMYDLENARRRNLYTGLNACWEKMHRGEVDDALERISAEAERAELQEVARDALQRMLTRSAKKKADGDHGSKPIAMQ